MRLFFYIFLVSLFFLSSGNSVEAANGRQIKTVEFALGNANDTTIASAANIYSKDTGIGSVNGWTTTAPTVGSDGFNIKINAQNVQIKSAWVEFRGVTVTTNASMSDMNMAISTCPGSVASCASAPTYRELSLFGTPATVFYFTQTGENNVVYVKADATAAFSGLSDSQWATGVETLLRLSAPAPTPTSDPAPTPAPEATPAEVIVDNEEVSTSTGDVVVEETATSTEAVGELPAGSGEDMTVIPQVETSVPEPALEPVSPTVTPTDPIPTPAPETSPIPSQTSTPEPTV